MTIKEAEERFYYEVEVCKQREIAKAKKKRLICNIIGAVLIIIGIVLTIFGFTATPKEVLSDRYEIHTIGTTFERVGGITAMFIGASIMLFMNIVVCIAIKRGQIDLSPHIEALYLNYLKCEDMKPEYKEFYKQKLEGIRNANLVNAIRRASSATSSAIIFSTLYK